jgi:uncharacterized membrane protein YkvA (DUF1232 family)
MRSTSRAEIPVSWYAKALVILIVAYALSPIDLIPDFVPVLGYLDDLVLVPLGIAASRYVSSRLRSSPSTGGTRAESLASQRPRSRLGAAIVVVVWCAAALWLGSLAWRLLTA